MALYEVLYHHAAVWKVGETKTEREARFREVSASLATEERYPGCYAGRIISSRRVRDVIQKRRPSLREMSSKDWLVVTLDLSPAEVNAVACGGAKIVGDALANVTFEDRWGAVAPVLRRQFRSPEEVEAYGEELDHGIVDMDGRRFVALAELLHDMLPLAEMHTGTGLYAVKVTPTKNDDTQSGAPAGQVVTLTTGGLGTADAFKGGYVTNMTRSETRAIVSHNDGDVTLEGDLSSWADTDDLDIYDGWSTIQGALDQLETDQGTGVAFTATQTVRIYAGTYTENISISDATFNTEEDYRLVVEANSGDTPIIQNSGASHTWTHALWDSYFTYTGLHFKSSVNNKYSLYGYSCTRINLEDCVFEDTSGVTDGGCAIFRATFGEVIGCRFVNGLVDLGSGLYREGTFEDVDDVRLWGIETRIEACWFRFAATGRLYSASQDATTNVLNCTLYGDGSATAFDGGSYTSRVRVRNCIVKNWGKAFSLKAGSAADADFNCYHGVTTLGTYDGTDYTTLANWQAADIPKDFLGNTVNPDASSIDDDPLLTNPATGDFSLGTGSPSRHRGCGAGVKKDVNGDPLDPYHPDQGAVSTGIGPNISVGG